MSKSGRKKQQDAGATPPFPESGYSIALQRTLKEKFDKGDIGGVDKEKFLKLLGKSAQPRNEEE